MTSLVSLMTLNYFKTSNKILTKLGTFYLAFSDARCKRIELGNSYLVNIEILISLLDYLYIIKRKFKCFC